MYLQIPPEPVWAPKVSAEDWKHAESFLRLAFPDDVAAAHLKALRAAPVVQVCAEDVLRAAGSRARVEPARLDGEPMSPILFIRGSSSLALDGVIVDGLDRLLAVAPGALVPVKVTHSATMQA